MHSCNASHIFLQRLTYFPATSHIFLQRLTHIPATPHIFSCNVSHIFLQRLTIFLQRLTHFPATPHTFSCNASHMFLQRFTHFPATFHTFSCSVSCIPATSHVFVSQHSISGQLSQKQNSNNSHVFASQHLTSWSQEPVMNMPVSMGYHATLVTCKWLHYQLGRPKVNQTTSIKDEFKFPASETMCSLSHGGPRHTGDL